MSEGDHRHGPRSSSDLSHNHKELESIRRNEQWSSLDSCIIPNRIRVPSANVKSKYPQPGTEDFQVALNLLNIESKIKPAEHHRSRESTGPKRATKAFTSIDEDLFEAETRSFLRDISATSKRSSQRTSSSNSGSVIVHSENLPALERLLQQHNLQHLHIGACSEHEAHPSKVHSDTEPIRKRPQSGVASSVGVANPRTSFPHERPENADNGLLGTEQERKASSSSEAALDPREDFDYKKDTTSEPPLLTSISVQDLTTLQASEVQHPLRPSKTCQTLRNNKRARLGFLRRSSRSALDLLKAATPSNAKPIDRLHPLKDQSIQDLARKLGVRPIELPMASSPAGIQLPICYTCPINHLTNEGASATEIFAAPVNQKVVDAYCVAFAELLKSVEEDSAVLKTVAGYDFPQTKELAKYDKEQGPSEIGAALIRMLSDLPGGVIGSPAVFNKLRLAIHNWRRDRHDELFVNDQPLSRFVAKTISNIPEQLHIDLICALFGLMHSSKRGEGDIAIMAHVIAPVMLNASVDEVDLEGMDVKTCRRMGRLRNAWRRMLRLPAKDPLAIKKLGACEYLAGELLRMWKPVIKEMAGLKRKGALVSLKDVQNQPSGSSSSYSHHSKTA